jgi:putative FmdB family regulatory protein
MSGLLNAWDVAHLGSRLLMMQGLENCQMAYYEFKCSICTATYGINRDINADGDVPAPECRKCNVTTERIFSITGAVFKGNGWGKDA